MSSEKIERTSSRTSRSEKSRGENRSRIEQWIEDCEVSDKIEEREEGTFGIVTGEDVGADFVDPTHLVEIDGERTVKVDGEIKKVKGMVVSEKYPPNMIDGQGEISDEDARRKLAEKMIEAGILSKKDVTLNTVETVAGTLERAGFKGTDASASVSLGEYFLWHPDHHDLYFLDPGQNPDSAFERRLEAVFEDDDAFVHGQAPIDEIAEYVFNEVSGDGSFYERIADGTDLTELIVKEAGISESDYSELVNEHGSAEKAVGSIIADDEDGRITQGDLEKLLHENDRAAITVISFANSYHGTFETGSNISGEKIIENEGVAFFDEERKNLVETIMGVVAEENMGRSASDARTDEEMDEFREQLEDASDEDLLDYWHSWVGVWLASRNMDPEEQLEKTLDGEQDYGFV